MRFLVIPLVAMAMAACTGCGARPLVLQGVVVSYDAGANIVTVKDDMPPNPEVTFSLAGSDIGATPAPGERVRLSYWDAGGGRRAIRMMNLTRQSEVSRSGGAH